MADNMPPEEVEAARGKTQMGSCDCCDSDDVRVKAYRVEDGPFSVDNQKWTIRWYCDLCAGTMASEWSRYGRPEAHILSGMAYMVNTLLKHIDARTGRIKEMIERAES